METNAFSAEYGRTTGGVVTIVTKAGGNDLQRERLRVPPRQRAGRARFLRQARGPAAVPTSSGNQFGGVVGGPIRKDRTFFFAAYEGLRQNYPQTLISTVPTDLQRRGRLLADLRQPGTARGGLRPADHDPASRTARVVRQPFPGNVIPADRIDPVALKVMSYYPQAEPARGLRRRGRTTTSTTAASGRRPTTTASGSTTRSGRAAACSPATPTPAARVSRPCAGTGRARGTPASSIDRYYNATIGRDPRLLADPDRRPARRVRPRPRRAGVARVPDRRPRPAGQLRRRRPRPVPLFRHQRRHARWAARRSTISRGTPTRSSGTSTRRRAATSCGSAPTCACSSSTRSRTTTRPAGSSSTAA